MFLGLEIGRLDGVAGSRIRMSLWSSLDMRLGWDCGDDAAEYDIVGEGGGEVGFEEE